MANNKSSKSKKNGFFKRFPFGWILAIFLVYIVLSSITGSVAVSGIPKEISYSEFYAILKDSPGKIKSVTKIETVLQGELTDNSKFFVNIPENDTELLDLMRKNLTKFEVKPPRTFLANLFWSLSPVILFLVSASWA